MCYRYYEKLVASLNFSRFMNFFSSKLYNLLSFLFCFKGIEFLYVYIILGKGSMYYGELSVL